MLNKIRAELFCISGIKIPLIVCCSVSAVFGVLTWITTGGIPLFWRVMKKPALCPPLFVLFILSVALCVFWGVLAAVCSGVRRGVPNALISAAAGFFLSLFWCPLFFAARGTVAACSLAASALCPIPAAVRCGRAYPALLVTAVPVWLIAAYLFYLSAGFAVLN